jgi:hypothetical protein
MRFVWSSSVLPAKREDICIHASLFTYDLHKDAANILDFVASDDMWLVTNELERMRKEADVE